MPNIATLAEIHSLERRIGELKQELSERTAYLAQLYADAGTTAPDDTQVLEITIKAVPKHEPAPPKPEPEAAEVK